MATCFTRKYCFSTPMPRFRAWLNYKHVFRGCTSTTFEAFQSPSPLQTFSNSEFGDVRVITKDGEPWFVGKDVAEALGYKNTRQAISTNIMDDDRGVHSVDTPSSTQQMTIINESGLYSLILSSKLPSAKKFKHWVTSEVLPSIRKTGGYVDENRSDLFLDICKCDTKRA